MHNAITLLLKKQKGSTISLSRLRMQHFILCFGHNHDNSQPSSLLPEKEHKHSSPSSFTFFLPAQITEKCREVRVDSCFLCNMRENHSFPHIPNFWAQYPVRFHSRVQSKGLRNRQLVRLTNPFSVTYFEIFRLCINNVNNVTV